MYKFQPGGTPHECVCMFFNFWLACDFMLVYNWSFNDCPPTQLSVSLANQHFCMLFFIQSGWFTTPVKQSHTLGRLDAQARWSLMQSVELDVFWRDNGSFRWNNSSKRKFGNFPAKESFYEAFTLGKKADYALFYVKHSWLAGCDVTNAFYCLPCLLFQSVGAEVLWTTTETWNICLKNANGTKVAIVILTTAWLLSVAREQIIREAQNRDLFYFMFFFLINPGRWEDRYCHTVPTCACAVLHWWQTQRAGKSFWVHSSAVSYIQVHCYCIKRASCCHWNRKVCSSARCMMEPVWWGVPLQVFREKDVYPNAHCIHCYAHELNLITQQATAHVSQGETFFFWLGGFASFFSRSPKHTYCMFLIKWCPVDCQHAATSDWTFTAEPSTLCLSTGSISFTVLRTYDTQVTLTPVPSERREPWPCYWNIRTSGSYWNFFTTLFHMWTSSMPSSRRRT